MKEEVVAELPCVQPGEPRSERAEGSQAQEKALPEKLQQVLDDLSFFPDRSDRIQMLLSIAERFRPAPPEVAEKPYGEAHKVPACESEAYAWAVPRPDGTLDFHFAVENPQGVSAMALGAILQDSLSGEDLRRVAAVPADVVYQIFGRDLSMGKSMGLMGMVSMVQNFAKKALGRE